MSDSEFSENENREESSEDERNRNAKRLKIDDESLESDKESIDNPSLIDEETASSSFDSSGSRSSPIDRNVNNRNDEFNRDDESSANESASEEQDDTNDDNENENEIETIVIHDTSSESSRSSPVKTDIDREFGGELAVLRKPKPKHSWFLVNEIINRQRGTSSKFRPELFRSRCHGSLYSVQRLELTHNLENHTACVNSLNFDRDGFLLISGSDDTKVTVWNWEKGKSLFAFHTRHIGNVLQSKFLPLSGDLYIATSGRDGQVRLAQVSAQEGLRTTRRLGLHRGPCPKLAILNDEQQMFLSVGDDGFVYKFDVRNPKPNILTYLSKDGQDLPLYSISVHPSKNHEFCVAGRDYVVRTYDQRKCGSLFPPLHEYYPFKSPSVCVTSVEYNHSGTEILASYNDENIYLFDVNGPEGSYLHQYVGHRNKVAIKNAVFFGPKSEYIVSGSDCGNVFFWDTKSQAIVQYFLADNNGNVTCVEPHPFMPFICTSGLDWDIKVWVPSHKEEPDLAGIERTVKGNIGSRFHTVRNINESQ